MSATRLLGQPLIRFESEAFEVKDMSAGSTDTSVGDPDLSERREPAGRSHQSSPSAPPAGTPIIEAAGAGSDQASAYLRRVPVPATNGLVHLVKPEDILWIEAANQYVRLHTAATTYLLRLALSVLEERLDPSDFLRIHRGSIVRLDSVAAMQRHGNTRGEAILSDGTRLAVSNRRWAQLGHSLAGAGFDIGF